MYLTFDEYEEYGGTLDETAFEELEYEARAQIDYWTFSRLVNDETVSEPVKRCMYALINLINDKKKLLAVSIPTDTEDAVSARIMSQSNDGVSVSYGVMTTNKVIDTMQDDLRAVINQYLWNVRNSLGQKVLYRGLYSNE